MTEPASDNSITVDIYDQTYNLRGQDVEYIRRLAEMVDGKMRAVAAHGKTVDSLRVAVLAALNLADEIFRHRQARDDRASHILDRAGRIERLVDEALAAEPRLR